MKQRILSFLAVLLLLPGLAQAKIFLADTDDTLRVVTASGVSTIHMYASWADLTTSALTPGSSTARVTTATTTVLVAAPAASTQRQIKGFSVRNAHASSSNVITIQFFDGTNATELIQYTLLAGETLQWGEDENFRIIDASGQVKGAVTANAGTNLNTSSLLTTSAHDAAFGTAGSADSQVRSVQGIASMTPLLVNPGTASNFGITSFGSAIPSTGAAAGFTDGTNMVAGRVVTSPPSSGDAGLVVRPISPASSTVGSAAPSVGVQITGTDGTNARAIKTDTNGEVQVDVLTLPSNASVNVAQMNGVATSMGNGASGTGTQRVTIANDSTGTVTVTQGTGTNLHIVCDSGCSSSSGFADNGAFTFGTTSINPIGGVFDDTSPNTATENSAAIARITQNKALHMNLRNASGTEIGTASNAVRTDPTGTTPQPATQSGTWTVQPGNTANTTPWLTSPIPATSGGTSVCYLSSGASTNATNCKNAAGQLYGFDLINTTTTIYYLRLYNLSSSPTCSSATGFVRTIPVPPAGAAGQAGGITRSIPVGEAYGTGIGFCLTGGGSSTDNTNAATGVYVSLNYK